MCEWITFSEDLIVPIDIYEILVSGKTSTGDLPCMSLLILVEYM